MVAEVCMLPPAEITPQSVRDADALIVRTRTRVNGALLDGSCVRYVATATIGYDHIDRTYLAERGIHWTSCPGCNAQGVCDYVETALHYHFPAGIPPHLTIGIVGVGHVGSLVEQMARRKGLRVLLCDPPRAAREGEEGFVGMDVIAREADIITFHTPLDETTRHLCNDTLLDACRPDALIINSARGGIVDEQALLRHTNPYVIDCWEGEPNISEAVLARAEQATFHIAGYTRYGKYRASQMVLDDFSAFFGLKTLIIDEKAVPLQAESLFDMPSLTAALKAAPSQFETLREQYPLR